LRSRWLLAVLVAASVGRSDGDSNLRGQVTKSADGKTYFGIGERDASCAVASLDGKEWPHAAGVYAPIAPGAHTLDCGGEYGFTVDAGTTFLFNYWGP
jgi:hypothetical protein